MCCLLRVAGRAAYHKGQLELAESEYRQAIDTDSGKMAAWEGLANVQMAHGDTQEGAETYIRLVRPFSGHRKLRHALHADPHDVLYADPHQLCSLSNSRLYTRHADL